MSVVHQRGNARISGNLTPMIDMIFLLIVFFVLVSRIVDRERVEMNLPQPKHAATERAAEEQRVVINVLPGAPGEVKGYRVGGTPFEPGSSGLMALTQHVASLYRTNPHINVNVRADRSAPYEHVEPVIEALSRAARMAGAPAARVNLVVVQEN